MVSIAHVGHGHWGKNLARNFSDLGALAVVVDPLAGEAAARGYGVRSATFEEALADPAIEAMSIASPAGLHFEQARSALEAGKHVYVEKPLALQVAQAEQLCALASRSRRVLMIGHLMQYHPVYVRLKTMAAAGEFGRLFYVYSNRLSLGKFRAEENVLWSFAPHDVSMILGLLDRQPLHVSAQGNASFLQGIADVATVEMHFAGGGSAHVFTSWMHPFKEQRLVVIGEKAMAVFEDSAPRWEDKLRIYRHSIDISGPVPVPNRADAESVAVPFAEPLKEECLHFIQCIENDGLPRTDGEEGLAVLRVLDRAEQALRDNLATQQKAR